MFAMAAGKQPDIRKIFEENPELEQLSIGLILGDRTIFRSLADTLQAMRYQWRRKVLAVYLRLALH